MKQASALPVRVVEWPNDRATMRQVRALDEKEFSSGTRIDPEQELTRPFTRGWIARIAGTGHLAGYLLTWHVADELHILNIATDRALRRRGVASALLEQALRYARQRRVRLLLLEVRRGNYAAIKLYRKFGFFVTGLRPRYYTDNQEDAVEFTLTLDPDTGEVIAGSDAIDLEE